MGPHKKFNAVERGHRSQPEEQNKGDGNKPLRCWTCGGEHRRRDYASHQGNRSQIYNAWET